MNKLPKDIYHFKGGKLSGPDVLILGGTHGDELAGIAVVKEIITRLNFMKINEENCLKGNLYVGFGSPAAISKNVRGITNRNLNRSFDPILLKDYSPNKIDSADLSRAKELAPLLLKVDFLFDIHSTSSPSNPFVCLSHITSQNKPFLPLFYVACILTDPDNILGKEQKQKVIGTTDYFVNTFGKGRGYCYETGLASDNSKNESIIENLLDILVKIGSATGDIYKLFGLEKPASKTKKLKQNIYELTDLVIAKSSVFHYAKGMNRGWKKVFSDQLVGNYSNGEAVVIPCNGYYLFPKAESKIEKGKSLFYIAEKCG
ncbi:MAG: succinylglutamate desuccinylase/aspartoacylase family protein [Patescibacteria group bacterium]|nr:succinylglutamate desuccinylase/aspartoacylase family protein [Patescibacteria group bacterium]